MSETFNTVFYEKGTKWPTANLTEIATQNQSKQVLGELNKEARLEKIKAVGKIALGVIAAIALFTVLTTTMATVGTLTSLISFPLMVIPPLHALVVSAASLAAGGLVLYFAVNEYGSRVMNHIRETKGHIQHLNQQIEVVKTHNKQFATS